MTTVRTAVPGDLDEVVGLWGRAAGPTRIAGSRRDVQRLVSRDPEALLVADRGGEIVGTLVVGWDGWRCHLYRLAVRADLRRGRIATELVHEARRRARSLGAARIDAMVAVGNTGAVSFWERAGFERDHTDARWSLLL